MTNPSRHAVTTWKLRSTKLFTATRICPVCKHEKSDVTAERLNILGLDLKPDERPKPVLYERSNRT